ncbi:MAG: hypothetical protein MZV63_00565 [Marinilabiliales bacterium]|nr:hypothetical protein [Marinilabiliales bacterium]
MACWRGETMKQWKERLIYSADKVRLPHTQTVVQTDRRNRRHSSGAVTGISSD